MGHPVQHFAIQPIRKIAVREMGDEIPPCVVREFSHSANLINCLARNSPNIDLVIVQLANVAINAHCYWWVLQNRSE